MTDPLTGARVAGLVLAGGRSSRFGSEKAMALHDGAPLIAVAARALLAICPAVAVSAQPDSGAAAYAGTGDMPLLSDREGAPDGPLSGLREGLAWAAGLDAEYLAVLPCDMPAMTAAVPAALLAALRTAPDHIGVAAAKDGAGLHPLCSVWRVSTLALVDAALADGGHPPVHAMLAKVGAVTLGFDDALFVNANRPGDLLA